MADCTKRMLKMASGGIHNRKPEKTNNYRAKHDWFRFYLEYNSKDASKNGISEVQPKPEP